MKEVFDEASSDNCVVHDRHSSDNMLEQHNSIGRVADFFSDYFSAFNNSLPRQTLRLSWHVSKVTVKASV